MKDETMDNQLALKLSWLAGIMDADGCFCAPASKRKNTYKVYPDVKIANTNEMIIAEVAEILGTLGIKYHVRQRASKRSHKQLTTIRVRRLSEVSKLIPFLLPYLVGKRGQAKLLKNFVDSRINRTGLKYNAKWNEEEARFLEQLHILNSKGRREKRGVNDCTVSATNHVVA